MRALLSLGHGYVGAALTRALGSGWHVTGTVRSPERAAQIAASGVQAYADAWAKLTRADRDIARAWFARARTDLAPLDPQVIADAQKTVDFFSGLGLIKAYPAQSLFDTSFNAAFGNN